MSIPLADSTVEYPVSSTGTESFPQNVIVKGSLWTLQLSFGRFIFKEYNGYFTILSTPIVNKYLLTPALKADRTINSDRFWVWIIDYSSNLTLYEIEPFPLSSPVITYTKSITTNVNNVSCFVRENDAVRVIVLSNSLSFSALTYRYITDLSPTSTSLTWDSSRVENFANYVDASNLSLNISYSKIGSPPNVFTDSYTVPVPLNLTLAQVGVTAFVDATWGTSAGSDQYELDRTSAGFPDWSSVYIGPLTHFVDPILATGTYYYHVKAQVTSILLQSVWSTTQSIYVSSSVVADFSGQQTDPLSNTVQFIDLSTGIPSSWQWNFGDGQTSDVQNPEHTYEISGIYYVTLLADIAPSITKVIFIRGALSSSVAINGTLILDGELTCYGDAQVAQRGLVIPIPDKATIRDYLVSKAYKTPNGSGRTITSLIKSIGVYGNIYGVGKGFGSDRGPGSNSSHMGLRGYGATHAGMGYIASASSPLLPYGNRETPVSLGSGSGYYHVPGEFSGREVRGGGAIKLVAESGYLIIRGSINMDGENGSYAGGASGGSIWGIGWLIKGDGTVSARGGSTTMVGAGGGGGGYISFWHADSFQFMGSMSVLDYSGGGHGEIFVKEIEPILEDRFTGTIWNTKWWNYSANVSLNNFTTFISPQDSYSFPFVESKFEISGRQIIAESSYKADASQIDSYRASFLLYADEGNWVGIARKRQGVFGISSANGLISCSGISMPNRDTNFRLVKSDGTFSFQYFDSTNPPITLYSDIRPELDHKIFKVRLGLDKPIFDSSSFRSEILRLTPLDTYRQSVELDCTPSDSSMVALNLLGSSAQYYGLDYYNYAGEDRVRWDSSGLGNFTTPFTLLITDYIILRQEDVDAKNVPLNFTPMDSTSIILNVVRGGGAQYYGVDFENVNDMIWWRNLGLDGYLEAGDELQVMYYFDPWNVTRFNEIVDTGDVVRLMYSWNPAANNDMTASFDKVQIYSGILQNSEAVDPTLYVDSNFGSDSSSGAQLSPLKNLFVATAWAKKGGTIVLYDGTYNPTAVIRKDLTIRGAEGTKPVITSAYSLDTTGSGWETNALYFYGAQGLIDNLTIRDSTVGVLLENSPDFEITRCEIYDCSTAVRFFN